MSFIRSLVPFVAFAGLSTQASAAIHEIHHQPLQPKPDESVLVTARMPEGTAKATLKLQAVAPGKYIRNTDAAYEKEWTDLPMLDDGKEADAKAGDGIFSVRVPATWQKHRWLVRYRIVVIDKDEKKLQAPPAEGPSPNFAWWCYAGPSPWEGTRDPGKTPILRFSPEFFNTMQTMHLLAKAEDVARSQWDGAFHRKKLPGTIIYHGVVHDHIQFSNRGQGSAHIAGKNKWGLKFNDRELPFHDFQDRDGIPFPATIRSLNLNPGGSTPYLPIFRGITGLDEVLSLRAYRLAGVPSPPATWVQWRVVQDADEVDPKNQFKTDLWGPYVAIGEMDPKILANAKLPDGLTVSMQSGIKHTPKGMTDAGKEWEKFLNEMRSNPREAWWRKNLDLPAYFSFHALNRLLGNVDIRPDGNHGYYRYPDGRWAPIPWDMDMMFVPRHHQPGHIDAVRCLSHPAIALEYRNRAREILDLFASDAGEQGGQVGQLAADLSSALTPKGFEVDWPRLDEALWNRHPRMNQKGTFFLNTYSASHFGGPWKRTIETNDFAGLRKYVVDFCTDSRPTKNYKPNDGDQRGYGYGYLAHEAKDEKIPATPTVKRDGKHFEASAFASPAMAKAASLEWRVGRIGQPRGYELADHWRKNIDSGVRVEIPPEVFGPGEYRVRARWRDDTGRCSHWSVPIVIIPHK